MQPNFATYLINISSKLLVRGPYHYYRTRTAVGQNFYLIVTQQSDRGRPKEQKKGVIGRLEGMPRDVLRLRETDEIQRLCYMQDESIVPQTFQPEVAASAA